MVYVFYFEVEISFNFNNKSWDDILSWIGISYYFLWNIKIFVLYIEIIEFYWGVRIVVLFCWLVNLYLYL